MSNAQLQCYRSYATRPASRPKAHTGRTTSSPRVKKPKATEKAGEIQTTAKVTKPKAPTKTKTASKTKAATKVKAKPKAKSRTKPKAKVRAKKPVTEEQKAAAALKKQSAHVRELKKLALSPPKLKPNSAWLVLTSEMAKERKRIAAKEAAEKYKSLVPEEKEVSTACLVSYTIGYILLTELFSITTILQMRTKPRTKESIKSGYIQSLRTMCEQPIMHDIP